MSDDGKKTPQQLKREAFEQNPDDFVDLNEIIIALKRTEKGPALFLKPESRLEMVLAKAEIEIALTKEILKFDTAQQMMKQKIVKSTNIANVQKFRNFWRNKKR